MRHLLRAGLLWLAVAVLPAQAGEKVFVDAGVAIRGYDPVAYHLDRAPVAGDAAFVYRWKDADWLFRSAAHRDLFAADPARYAPKYNGYCAYAASKGYIAPTDPNAWTIHDGRLYLNYSIGVRQTWLEHVDTNIAAADRNWPTLASP